MPHRNSLNTRRYSRAILFGIFYCPSCGARKRILLPRSGKKIFQPTTEIFSKILQKIRNTCPCCRQNMWLEKVVDTFGRIIVDNKDKMNPGGNGHIFVN